MPPSPLLLAALLVVAETVPPPPAAGAPDERAAGATRDPELRALLEDWWGWSGCAGHEGPDLARSARCSWGGDAAADLREQGALRERAEALDAARLDAFDRVNLLVFRWMLAQALKPLPGAEAGAGYAVAIRWTVGQDLDPEALHQRGLAQVAAGQRRIAELLGADGFAAARDALRRPEWTYADESELQADAWAAVGQSARAVAAAFPGAPPQPCEPLFGPHPVGQYIPAEGGSAGAWLVDTTPGEGLTRYSVRPVGFHECWPGHHLQYAAHEARRDLPRFRWLSRTTAYSEGWATYAELELAQDLGLYSGLPDQIGAAAGELRRWARVVVDTGLHHRGWSAEQAEGYLREQTPLHERHVQIELQRMRESPGWLIAHAVGLDAFRAARAAAARAAGERFDPVAFAVFLHDLGPAPPDVLAAEAARWGQERAAK